MGQEKRNLSAGILIRRRSILPHTATLILCILYYIYVQDDPSIYIQDNPNFWINLAVINVVRVSWLYYIAFLVSRQHGPRKAKFIRRNVNCT